MTGSTPIDATSSTGGVSGAVGSAVGNVVSTAFSFLFTSRFAAVALGLIAIAGAIYLFKSPDVIQSVKSGAKAAVAF
jgi:hypothetical protein